MYATAKADTGNFLDVAGQLPGPIVPMMHATLAYESAGENVFSLGIQQQRQFSEIDLSGLPLEDLQLPFDSFYVAMDGQCDFSLYAAGRYGQSVHPVKGVYVTRVPSAHCPWDMRTTGAEHITTSLVVCIWAKSQQAAPWDDIMHAIPIPIDDQTKATSELFRGYAFNHDPTILPDDIEPNLATGEAMTRMVLGMCAYLQSRECETRIVNPAPERGRLAVVVEKGGRKAAKAARRLVRLPEKPYRIVAPGMTYVPSFSRTVSTHWRRGHVRSVWVGPRKAADGTPQKGSHREVRFIPACLVEGNAKTPTVPKTYVVEGASPK